MADADMTIIRTQAERKFLGREHVIGVALAKTRSAERIVFFLDDESKTVEKRIADWAGNIGVEFEFRIVGGFRPV
jgi:hypothetical protein